MRRRGFQKDFRLLMGVLTYLTGLLSVNAQNWVATYGGITPWEGAISTGGKLDPDPAVDANGKAWFEEGYDDSSWSKVTGGICQDSLSTLPWHGVNTAHWVRRSFTIDRVRPYVYQLKMCHDNECRVFLNGEMVCQEKTCSDRIVDFDNSLLHEGANTLAVWTSTDGGYCNLDLGIFYDLLFTADGIKYHVIGENEVEVVRSDDYHGRSLVIPASVEHEGHAYCVTHIAPNSFEDLELKGLSLPSSIKTIDAGTFANTGLSVIKIPASVTEIQGDFMSDRPKTVQSFEVEEANPVFYAMDGVLYNTRDGILVRYPTKKPDLTYAIPATVNGRAITKIGNHAFQSVSGLRTLILPASISYICSSAFEPDGFNTSIENVDVLSATPPLCESNAIDGLRDLPITVPVNSVSDYLDSYQWNETRMLGAGFFVENGIKYAITGENTLRVAANDYRGELTIPESLSHEGMTYTVTSTQSQIYSNCTYVHLPNTIKQLPDLLFWQATQLKAVHLPEYVTTIPYGAFSECVSLEDVTIPSTVTSLDAYSFYNTQNLTRVVIPEGVLELHNCAFRYSAISSVALPSTLTRVDGNVFGENANLTTINCFASEVPQYALEETFNKEAITLCVADCVVENFAGDANWSDFTIVPLGQDMPKTSIEAPNQTVLTDDELPMLASITASADWEDGDMLDPSSRLDVATIGDSIVTALVAGNEAAMDYSDQNYSVASNVGNAESLLLSDRNVKNEAVDDAGYRCADTTTDVTSPVAADESQIPNNADSLSMLCAVVSVTDEAFESDATMALDSRGDVLAEHDGIPQQAPSEASDSYAAVPPDDIRHNLKPGVGEKGDVAHDIVEVDNQLAAGNAKTGNDKIPSSADHRIMTEMAWDERYLLRQRRQQLQWNFLLGLLAVRTIRRHRRSGCPGSDDLTTS